MQIVGPVNSAEWGSYRRLTAQDRDEQREALFPWASSEDTLSEPGALTGAELRALARRRFRSTTTDADAALDDGLAALRALNDLLEVHAGSACRETAGVRVSATASYVGMANSGAHVFAYRLRIANKRPDTVRLESRRSVHESWLPRHRRACDHWYLCAGGAGRSRPCPTGRRKKLSPGAHLEWSGKLQHLAKAPSSSTRRGRSSRPRPGPCGAASSSSLSRATSASRRKCRPSRSWRPPRKLICECYLLVGRSSSPR